MENNFFTFIGYQNITKISKLYVNQITYVIGMLLFELERIFQL